MSTELIELVGFLHAVQPALRYVALENLVGFSQGDKTFIFKNDDYRAVKDIQKLVQEPRQQVQGQALKILINLCDDPQILDMLATDEFFVYYIANQVTNLSSIHADLYCILLVNLAKNDQIIKLLNKKRTESVAVRIDASEKMAEPQLVTDHEAFKSHVILDCLMDCFVKGSDRSLNKYADFDYLAYFFSDLSRFKEGRDYFVRSQAYDGVVPITKLLVFTDHNSNIRRAGVASTIKNALFDVQSHHEFIFNEDVNLLIYLLRPLIDGFDDIPEDEMLELPDELQFMPPEKKRESNSNILATHVESLLLLCTSREVREYFREKRVYSVIRELHKNVEDDLVRDTCERLVNMIMRDEEEKKRKVEELDADEESDEEIVEVV